MSALDPARHPSRHEWTLRVGSTHSNKPSPTIRSTHAMSPGVPSRLAELGGDPHRLAEAFHRLLVKAECEDIARAAVMQAIAIQTLATSVGRLVEAIEADNASARTLSMPAASPPQDTYGPRCGHTRGFGRTCNSPDGGPNGPRCGCANRFHADGVR